MKPEDHNQPPVDDFRIQVSRFPVVRDKYVPRIEQGRYPDVPHILPQHPAATRRVHSRDSHHLEGLINPLRPDEFRRSYYGNRPLFVKGSVQKYRSLFDWDALTAFLNASPIPHPMMRLSLRGELLDADDATEVIEHCRAGATMIVNRIHEYEPRIGQFAAELAAELGEPVNVNMYLSQPEQPAFGRHYDTHDVFILQLSGMKNWAVYDHPAEFPLFEAAHHASVPPTATRLTHVLEPGDTLYIPRGHWHDATASEQQSLHLTVGIDAHTGVDFLTWIVNELRDDVLCRESLPLVYSNERDTPIADHVVRTHIDAILSRLLAKCEDSDTLPSYLRYRVASDRNTNRFSLPDQLLASPVDDSRTGLFHRQRYQRAILEQDDATGEVILTVWGKVIRAPVACRALLDFILASESFSYGDCRVAAQQLTDMNTRTLLDCLLRESIISRPDAKT